MQQGQDYRRFGYQPLQGSGSNLSASRPQGARASGSHNYSQSNSGGSLMSRFTNSPLLSTVGILAAGGVFAFALYSFYPSSDAQNEAVPVIKAEATPIKIEPAQVGGMEIPFQDSTVYDSMRQAENAKAVRIENLLDPAVGNEEPMSREEVVAKVKEQSPPTLNLTEGIPQPSSVEQEEVAEVASEDELQAVSEEAAADVEVTKTITVTETVEKKPIRNILEEEAVAASNDGKEMHDAASSPETLAFVRSVLDKKDQESSAAKTAEPKVAAAAAPSVEAAPEKVEPAAGVEGQIVTKGSHYVQLASITDKARANTEWAKLKEQLSAIPGASGFRVQEAALEKGTFYRIQAGPYSEAQAKSICESIKTQKPGGCFVVQ